MTATLEQVEEEYEEPLDGENDEVPEVMDEVASLNALSGSEVPNIITLKGEYKMHTMTILLALGVLTVS